MGGSIAPESPLDQPPARARANCLDSPDPDSPCAASRASHRAGSRHGPSGSPERPASLAFQEQRSLGRVETQRSPSPPTPLAAGPSLSNVLGRSVGLL